MDGSRRNGNKRRSGIFDPALLSSAGHQSSRTVISPDLYSQTPAEVPSEPPVRAGTPDNPRESGRGARSPAPTSVPPSSPASRRTADLVDRRTRAGSRPLPPVERPAAARPRTRTMEERVRNASPGHPRLSPMNHSSGRASSPESDDQSSSIGYPSIVASGSTSTPGGSHRNRMIRSPPRPLSPATTQHGVPTFPVDMDTLPSPTSDTSRIFSLMKTTCGRMHGILSFRTNANNPWLSGYCAINVATGSLIYQESKGSITQTKTLITDLRGCQVRTQGTQFSETGYIEIYNSSSGTRVHLRPRVPETFSSWLAALLCWQPLKPKSPTNNVERLARPAVSELRPIHQRRNSSFNLKDATTIKFGQMLYWDHDARVATPQSPRRISTYKQQRSASGTPWRRASATLQSNGLLKLYLEKDNTLLSMVPLASLCRSAVQRMHPSVVEDEYCIGVFPQYTTLTHPPLGLRRPIYLSLESRVLFEAWFSLFKAFTIPELYGPESSAITSPAQYVDGSVEPPSINTDNMFRLERTLSMRVTEAKLHSNSESASTSASASSRGGPPSADVPVNDYHAEVFIDGEIRGRTAVKSNTRNPFWREDYEFGDLPTILRTASVVIKSRNTGQRDWTLVSDGSYNHGETDIHNLNHMDIYGEIQISPLDNTIGTVVVNLDDLERCKDKDDWFPVLDEHGEVVGDLLLKVRLDESIVLMSQEYRPLLDLLESFSNGLTQQVVQTFPANELRQLPVTLLNIFQVAGKATEWLASLVEDEIDSIHKKPPAFSRFHFSRRIVQKDSYESNVQREIYYRDMNKNANVEANLLFRGNSLLTKALDAHMKRVGKEYLEDVLGDHIRDIDESDPDCEVDPLRVKDNNIIQKHWYNLITLTENVWNSITASVERCPPELRAIFRRIRTCAEDRFGEYQRNVGYSSVSGFLFLRFLCAAILNPKLFGLLKDHPRPRAQRTLTLMAKSLQTLANMSTYGSKEPWMQNMNTFLNARRQEFKDYVDDICSIAADRDPMPIPPPFATPNQIQNRLPVTSREGFPSLPYLLDVSSECATLVSVWIDATSEASAAEGADSANPRDDKSRDPEEERYLVEFDRLCHVLRAKTREVLGQAEQLDRPSGVLEVKWEEVVAQMDRKSHRLAQRPMRPQRLSSDPSLSSRKRSSPAPGSVGAAHESTTSLDDPQALASAEDPSLTSPPPLAPGSAPPFRTRAPAALSAEGTGASSPDDSTAHGSDSIWSSGTDEDRFPPHALSWGDVDDEAGDEVPPGPESDAAARASRLHRFGSRRLSDVQRSPGGGEHSGGSREIDEESALSPGLGSAASAAGSAVGLLDKDKGRERERELSNGGGGRRLIDGWGFRRKGGAVMAGSPTAPVSVRDRDKSRDKHDGETERGSSHSAGGSGSANARNKKRGKLSKE